MLFSDHVMTDEERKKLQARINTMKYKLNGGAILRPLDAQRLRRRVSQLTSLLRANQKRKAVAGAAGDSAEAGAKTPTKTPTKPLVPVSVLLASSLFRCRFTLKLTRNEFFWELHSIYNKYLKLYTKNNLLTLGNG